MRLASSSGASVELDIIGDAQPPPKVATAGDEGGDWLIIRGRVVELDRTWTFVSECLDTDDARELHTWLTGVADGSTTPSDTPGRGPHAITFVEPELGMRLIARVKCEPVIRWSFRGEAAPPWAADTEQSDGYAIEIDVGAVEVETAVSDWGSQLDSFPNR